MKSRNQRDHPTDAAGWDARLRSSDCTAEERMAFRKWCKESPENEKEYEQLRSILSTLRASSNAPEIRALREWAVANTGYFQRKRSLFRGGIAAVAAMFVLAIGIWMFHFDTLNFLSGGVEPITAYTTEIGERSTANLDDGSVAELNTDTQLTIEFSDTERRVNLIEGQAYFDVAKDETRPFVVVAGDQLIRAIGTAFDVLYIGGKVKVTLIEGVVNVAPDVSKMKGEAVQPAVQLEAGQKLTTTAMASPVPPTIETADTERSTIWRTGQVYFDNSTLAGAVTEMNRYSTVQIRVDSSSFDDIRMNGMFRTGQQKNFVDTLVAYYPIQAQRYGENLIVLKAK